MFCDFNPISKLQLKLPLISAMYIKRDCIQPERRYGRSAVWMLHSALYAIFWNVMKHEKLNLNLKKTKLEWGGDGLLLMSDKSIFSLVYNVL